MLRENQCGFRRGRDCADQPFSLCMLMERVREFHQPLFLCFVDLKKAYDSVNCEAMWAALELKFGFPPKVLNI